MAPNGGSKGDVREFPNPRSPRVRELLVCNVPEHCHDGKRPLEEPSSVASCRSPVEVSPSRLRGNKHHSLLCRKEQAMTK